MTSTMGLEVTLSKANFAKDPPYDEEVAKNTADGKVEELPSCLRLFRKINYVEYNPKGWGKPMNLTMYVMYVLIAALVSANAATADPLPNLRFVAWTCFGVWQVLNFLNSFYMWGSVRQTLAWAGPYKCLLDAMFQAGTITMVALSFRNYKIGPMELEYGLLIVMAGAIFVDQRMIDTSFKHLYYYYHGAITKDELKDGVPHNIAGISNSALLKIAAAAGKALRIPDDISFSIVLAYAHVINEFAGQVLQGVGFVIVSISLALPPFAEGLVTSSRLHEDGIANICDVALTGMRILIEMLYYPDWNRSNKFYLLFFPAEISPDD